MTKSILFDLDGTLTDSGEGIINCAIYALEYYGLPIPSEAELRTFVGPPLHESFVRFGVPEEEADNAIKIYRSRYIPIGKFENHPYDGIYHVLEQLKELGKKYSFETWAPMDDEYTAVRFCTSWATKEEDVEALIKDIENL